MLISVHIPKCGGITFEHVLRRIFGRRRLWLHYEPPPGSQEVMPDRLIPEGIRCVHGHFPSDAFDDLVPQAELVTWLRDPVERVVSSYHHFLRHPDPTNPSCRRMMEERMTLEQFAELGPMRNEAARYLAGKPLSTFRFVGVTDRFSESLEALGDALGIEAPAEPPRENVNPGRLTERYPIPDGTYERIRELNLLDLTAYEEATSLLDVRLERSRRPSAGGLQESRPGRMALSLSRKFRLTRILTPSFITRS
jgi:hypothetical protein